MIPKRPIHTVMSRQIHSVPTGSTVQTAVQLMSEKDIGSLLIQKDDQYIGIITETDMVKKIMAKGLDQKTTLVDDVMSFPVYTIDENEFLNTANEQMGEQKIRHLLVTSREKPVGILSVRNLLDAVYEWSVRLRI
ncbi:MAG TPA: CBS domain-containing protein [Nitrospiria bacterium]|jgi:signal-transduction protein with cAMP-binding, CBS, and nucleotidyltransferase domain